MIIKFNYFMRKIKSIIKFVEKNVLKFFIQTNAFNDYYVIKFWKSYIYKIEIIIALKQFCYLIMNFDLTKKFDTYIKMKNITIEKISKFDIKFALSKTIQNKMYDFYINNNVIDVFIFEFLYIFLHEHYFSRLSWAKLTLNSKKTRFFIKRVQILSFQRDENKIKSFVNKIIVIKNWLVSINEKSLLEFICILFYLKTLISRCKFRKIFWNEFA